MSSMNMSEPLLGKKTPAGRSGGSFLTKILSRMSGHPSMFTLLVFGVFVFGIAICAATYVILLDTWEKPYYAQLCNTGGEAISICIIEMVLFTPICFSYAVATTLLVAEIGRPPLKMQGPPSYHSFKLVAALLLIAAEITYQLLRLFWSEESDVPDSDIILVGGSMRILMWASLCSRHVWTGHVTHPWTMISLIFFYLATLCLRLQTWISEINDHTFSITEPSKLLLILQFALLIIIFPLELYYSVTEMEEIAPINTAPLTHRMAGQGGSQVFSGSQVYAAALQSGNSLWPRHLYYLIRTGGRRASLFFGTSVLISIVAAGFQLLALIQTAGLTDTVVSPIEPPNTISDISKMLLKDTLLILAFYFGQALTSHLMKASWAAFKCFGLTEKWLRYSVNHDSYQQQVEELAEVLTEKLCSLVEGAVVTTVGFSYLVGLSRHMSWMALLVSSPGMVAQLIASRWIAANSQAVSAARTNKDPGTIARAAFRKKCVEILVSFLEYYCFMGALTVGYYYGAQLCIWGDQAVEQVTPADFLKYVIVSEIVVQHGFWNLGKSIAEFAGTTGPALQLFPHLLHPGQDWWRFHDGLLVLRGIVDPVKVPEIDRLRIDRQLDEYGFYPYAGVWTSTVQRYRDAQQAPVEDDEQD